MILYMTKIRIATINLCDENPTKKSKRNEKFNNLKSIHNFTKSFLSGYQKRPNKWNFQ